MRSRRFHRLSPSVALASLPHELDCDHKTNALVLRRSNPTSQPMAFSQR